MAKLPKFQLKQCLKILDKLLEKSISKPFQQNLSENFGLPEPIKVYLGKPIDLLTIRENLKNDMYKSIQEWSCDVLLVFDNTISLFHSGSPLYVMAKDLRNWFEKKLKKFPRNSNEHWLVEFNSAHEKLQKLVDSYPMPKNYSNNISRYSHDEDTARPSHTSQSFQSSQKSIQYNKNDNNSNSSKVFKPLKDSKVSSFDNDELEDDLEDDSDKNNYHSSTHKNTNIAIIAEDPRKKETKKIESIELFPDLE